MTKLENLKKSVLHYNPKADLKLIEKAYKVAQAAHKGQVRDSGEPYFTHPYEVACILSKLKVQSATIAAALLHDVVEESNYTLKNIKEEFGSEVASLVEGVTKIDKVHFDSKADYTAENLRKVILATAKDVRIMLIKLADRLHNMRTLKTLTPNKQKRIAEETLSIYAPIAHKIGVWYIKGELEDLSLRYLEPDIYDVLRKKISSKRAEREDRTKELIKKIKERLKEHNIEADVFGRAKYFYSIYKKMRRKQVDFSEIYDLIAIRIITKNIPDCYAALGVIHDTWKPSPKKFKDYIATPKANGYQSLHTAVVTNDGKILEVQIRTEEMHSIAEDGIAAHWRYKGTERDKKFDKKISWIKQVLDWRSTAEDAQDFIESFKIDLFEKEIIVFTPKGDPIALPEDATPVDFAYEIHSIVGNTCSKSLVNSKLVPLDSALRAGDVVEIITQKNAKPSRQWIKFVKTGKARSKIRAALGIEAEHDPKKGQRDDPERNFVSLIACSDKTKQIKLSKCCMPKPDDKILGFYTKDGKITIHKEHCPNVSALHDNRVAICEWKKDLPKTARTVQILAEDRVGMIADILNAIASLKINIEKLNTETTRHRRFLITLSVLVPDDGVMHELKAKIRTLKEVVHVSELKTMPRRLRD